MRLVAMVIAVLLAATSALAHHSNSAFDGDKVMVLTGTVTEWKWTNPHVWIFLSVDDSNGGKVQWEIEGRTPGQLVRAGWSKTTLTVGETVTVRSEEHTSELQSLAYLVCRLLLEKKKKNKKTKIHRN